MLGSKPAEITLLKTSRSEINLCHCCQCSTQRQKPQRQDNAFTKAAWPHTSTQRSGAYLFVFEGRPASNNIYPAAFSLFSLFELHLITVTSHGLLFNEE